DIPMSYQHPLGKPRLQQLRSRRVLFPHTEQKALTSTRQKAFSGVVYTDLPFDGSGKRVGRVVDAGQKINDAAFSHNLIASCSCHGRRATIAARFSAAFFAARYSRAFMVP
ncbi:MAG: hypothetical protein KGM99_13290, partial [Burkholderiales bacterium]|nr:hypothetical protein [Burkholderiales bacterium]